MGKPKLQAPVPTEPEISIRHNAAPFARMCEGGNLIIGYSPSCIRPSMKRISILQRKKQDETLLGQTPRRITRSRSIAIKLSFETRGPTNPISPTSPTLNLILSLSLPPPLPPSVSRSHAPPSRASRIMPACLATTHVEKIGLPSTPTPYGLVLPKDRTAKPVVEGNSITELPSPPEPCRPKAKGQFHYK